MMNSLEITKALVERQSITPEDAGCMEYIQSLLSHHNLRVETFHKEDVKNLMLLHGDGAPHFCFMGHTDVVPTGDVAGWTHPPFEATIDGELLYGRGTADMKASIGAFIAAFDQFVSENPTHKGTISLLVTSDEEGAADYGIRHVAPELAKRDIKIDYCLVGEPSSFEEFGDMIKVGRRGSLGADLKVLGIQGHLAYPDRADNPIHKMGPVLADLCAQKWDQGNDYFPPTSFQISNINSGTGATNVIPGYLDMMFNFRFSTETNETELKSRVEAILDKHELSYEINWKLYGEPFLTEQGDFVQACASAIAEVADTTPELSTSGGTSDGRFIAPLGVEVIEFGPVSRSIHQVNEHVLVDDIKRLERVYLSMLNRLQK